MWVMELNSIKCVSYTDSMEDDNDAQRSSRARSSSWPPPPPSAQSSPLPPTVAGPLVPPATGVHELLECPVCLSLSRGGDDETGDDGGGETRQSLVGRCV
jgi:hypothetical protein